MTKEELSKKQKEIEEIGPSIKDSIDRHFGDLSDPRRAKSVTYRLS